MTGNDENIPEVDGVDPEDQVEVEFYGHDTEADDADLDTEFLDARVAVALYEPRKFEDNVAMETETEG